MKISVAIPCYNGADFVAAAIESLLQQTRPAQEIIVVDDGSADASRAVIRRFPVTLLEHERNRGLANARNTAIAAATGDVLAFVDVDATADRALLAVIEAGYDEPAIAGVGGQGIEVNIHSLADRWRRSHATQGFGPRAKFAPYLHGLCMSFRLDILRKVGGFSPEFSTNGEDVDLGLRITAAGYRLRYLPQARVYHQRTDDEHTLTRTMARWTVAGYRARQVNNARPWAQIAGAFRRLLADPLYDLVVERDLEMAQLSWQIGLAKLQALREVMVRAR